MPNLNGASMFIVTTPDRSPFNDGAYVADVQNEDKVVAQAHVRVTG